MDKFIIKQIVNNPVSSNCYIIYNSLVKECLVVDPGSKNPGELNKFLIEHDLRPQFIIITHHHFDHIWGVDNLVKRYGAKVVSSRICAHKVIDRKHNLSSFYEESGFAISPVEILVEDIDYRLLWLGSQIRFFDTKGHSDGCISILINDDLFTGDALLKDTEIITKLPGGSKMKLTESYNLYRSLLADNTDLMIYPGHGEIFKLDIRDLELNL